MSIIEPKPLARWRNSDIQRFGNFAMKITGAAAKLIINETRGYISELSEDDPLVSSVVWITGDTGLNRSIPRLGVGLVERRLVEGRFLNCDMFECEIANLVPDAILEANAGRSIGLLEAGLAFVKV